MPVISCDAFDNHEQVAFFSDAETGLKAIIAVHSTALGPSAGGCRMWDYASEDEAIRDVLRLSRGMSYKNAMAGLDLGGGKAVIIGNSRTDKTPELMRAFGRAVDALNGRYITAEDVGMSVADMEQVATQTKYVAGIDSGATASGDPSPYTAHGVFFGIKAAVKHALGRDDMQGLKVAVQGLGHVGHNLCRELAEAGADLIVADIAQDSVDSVVTELGATAVSVDDILTQDVDVLAPCALGAILDDTSIPNLNCRIIGGAANNQLAEPRHGQMVKDRGILYAPDYIINAGGIMNVAIEVSGQVHDHNAANRKVEEIYATLLQIFERADAEGRTTEEVADIEAEARIRAGRDGGGASSSRAA